MDTIVEVGLVGEFGDAEEFVSEVSEFGFEVLEGFELFAFAGGAIGFVAKLGGEVAGAEEFGFDVVVDAGVEGLVGEAVVVEPEGVAAGAGGEGEIEGGLAAAFGVAGEVVAKECGGFAEVISKVADFQDFADFLLNVAVLFSPNDFEDITDMANDIVGISFVVYENAIPDNPKRVLKFTNRRLTNRIF